MPASTLVSKWTKGKKEYQLSVRNVPLSVEEQAQHQLGHEQQQARQQRLARKLRLEAAKAKRGRGGEGRRTVGRWRQYLATHHVEGFGSGAEALAAFDKQLRTRPETVLAEVQRALAALGRKG